MFQTRAALAAKGYSGNQLRRMVTRQELRSIRRGVYSDQPEASGRGARHRELISATVPLLADDAVISHWSAALLHGWPQWDQDFNRVSVTRPGREGGSSSKHLVVHRCALKADEAMVLDGFRVTSPERTLCDLARLVPFERGVAAFDAALRQGVRREALEAKVNEFGGRPNVVRLRQVLGFADARSQSAGESFSRVVLRDLGLPTPAIQQPVHHSTTKAYLGTPDFLWEAQRITGEFDGELKYDGTFGPPSKKVMEEKRRRQGFIADGWRVMHWGWRDCRDPEGILEQWQAYTGSRRSRPAPWGGDW